MTISINKDMAQRMHNMASYALIFGYDGIYNTTNRFLEFGRYRVSDLDRLRQMCTSILRRLYREYCSRCVISRNDSEFLLAYNNMIGLLDDLS